MNVGNRGLRWLLSIGTAVTVLAGMAVMTRAPASAAGRHAGAGAAGTISTVAGGPGGPARATSVAVAGVGLAYGRGHLYLADGYVREVGRGGRLSTPVGATDAGNAALHDGGPAADAGVDASSVAVAPNGNLVIAGGNRVRVVAATTGTFYNVNMTAGSIYTVAGTFYQGFNGNGIPAVTAALSCPAVTVDRAGNLIISDTCNEQVRVVANKKGTFYGQRMQAGFIYDLAGDGVSGFSGDGGPAGAAELSLPAGAAVDSAGNVVFADSANNRIRVVAATTGSFYGQAMTAGDIYTIAGNGTPIIAPGAPATHSGMDRPLSVAVDSAGNVVLTATGSVRGVYRGRTRGVLVVAARTGSFYGQAMTAGDIYRVHVFPVRLPGGGSLSAKQGNAQSLTLDGAGNLVFDSGASYLAVYATRSGRFYGRSMQAGRSYAIAGNGSYSFSGDGGRASAAQLFYPQDVAADAAGNVVIADTYNNRIRVVAASSGRMYGQQMKAGHIYTVAGDGTGGYSGDGGPATSAGLNQPWGVTVDRAGNVVIADTQNHRIRVVAASTGTFYGQAMTAGNIYTVAGGGGGKGANGVPATEAHLRFPQSVAVDAAGNLVIDDRTACRVYTVADSTGTFYGRAMTAGDIYPVAGDRTCTSSADGGVAVRSALCLPEGVTVDARGNLVIADTCAHRIRVVANSSGRMYGQQMKARHIYTVAGDGTGGYSGDGGPATAAELNTPLGIAVDRAGGLVISDTLNNRVRVVPAVSGTFYGVAMTAGHIYTVAGDGTAGATGDRGPATGAELYDPGGIAVDGPNLVFADTSNYRVRMVSG